MDDEGVLYKTTSETITFRLFYSEYHERFDLEITSDNSNRFLRLVLPCIINQLKNVSFAIDIVDFLARTWERKAMFLEERINT